MGLGFPGLGFGKEGSGRHKHMGKGEPGTFRDPKLPTKIACTDFGVEGLGF